MLRRIQTFLQRGPRYVAKRLYARAFAPTARCFKAAAPHLRGRGIEIGGPSRIFQRRQLLPVYPIAKALDGCNFDSSTVWEGKLSEGMNFKFGGRTGYQFISEASRLKVDDASYDFVLSSDMLEHSANPIAVLREWLRVLKVDGHLLLVLPDGAKTFDHRRPVTKMTHLIEDLQHCRTEDDLTHLPEMLALHDLSMTPEYPNRESLRSRLEENFSYRCIHHHVFNERLAVELVGYSGFTVLSSELADPSHIIVFAQKVI
jgi:SAM-dependent methyltransferase